MMTTENLGGEQRQYLSRKAARVPDRDAQGKPYPVPPDPRDMLGDMVTLSRATKLAHVSRQTITLWVREGELIPVVDKAKIPGARGRPGRLFRRQDVIDCARAHGTLPLDQILEEKRNEQDN